MADDYWDDYIAMPDDAAFTRSPLSQIVPMALQNNVNHFYGTRTRQLVADCGLWYSVPNPGAAASTEPEYLVTVSEGVTRLWCTIIWTALDRNARAGIEVTFYSEDGGAAVAAGLHPSSSATVTDTWAGPSEPWGEPWEHYPFEAFVLVHPTAPNRPYLGRQLGGKGSAWVALTPDLTAGREQRIQVQARDDTANVRSAIDIWGVFIREEVPRG